MTSLIAAGPGARALALLLSFAAFAASAALPDLIINRSRLARSVEIKDQYFSASDCAVIEGCLTAPGTRRLLLFEVAFVNIGKADLVIGSPHDNPGLFEHSPCHGHHHLSGAASYELLRADGRSVLVGRKQAFCLRDNAPYSSASPPSRGYDCDYQGITAGWEDIYPKNLDCQWLDITGLAGGTYTLKVTVNPVRVFEEANYANNASSITVLIPAKPSRPAPPRVTPPKTPPPKIHPPHQKPPPKHVKKPKTTKRNGWYNRPIRKPAPKAPPKPTHHQDDDDDDRSGSSGRHHDDDDD